MKVGYKLTGFSKVTDDQRFDLDIEETQESLRPLMGLDNQDPMVDVYPILTAEQQAFFASKYGVEFFDENDYFIEAYQ